MTITLICLIALALLFDFLNGFNDSANAIATIVSTRVLSPRRAVIWAAFFNFAAFLIFGTHVATTIGKGVVTLGVMDSAVICAALIGACLWDIIAWYLGLPTSSSHALIGGMLGATIIKAGSGAIIVPGIVKILAFIVISPVVGLFFGVLIGTLVHRGFRYFAPRKVDKIFRKGQLVSAALFALGHGGNDAQKTMGIVTTLLLSAGVISEFKVPTWVVIACQSAIALGTLFGGWRIVKTMGQKVAKLKPVDGFCAESGAASSLYISTFLGIPVSTTQTITGAIMGVGSLHRLSAVRWSVAGRIVWAWILTIPCAGVVSALTYFVCRRIIH